MVVLIQESLVVVCKCEIYFTSCWIQYPYNEYFEFVWSILAGLHHLYPVGFGVYSVLYLGIDVV